jgi:hypothetical protein
MVVYALVTWRLLEGRDRFMLLSVHLNLFVGFLNPPKLREFLVESNEIANF